MAPAEFAALVLDSCVADPRRVAWLRADYARVRPDGSLAPSDPEAQLRAALAPLADRQGCLPRQALVALLGRLGHSTAAAEAAAAELARLGADSVDGFAVRMRDAFAANPAMLQHLAAP